MIEITCKVILASNSKIFRQRDSRQKECFQTTSNISLKKYQPSRTWRHLKAQQSSLLVSKLKKLSFSNEIM